MDSKADNVAQEYKKALGDKLEIVTAFSRQSSKKVYVQHRLKERAQEVQELLGQRAYFYVCGDAANMAREVHAVLTQIIAEGRGLSEAKAEEVVKKMRASNQYQVCALGIHPIPPFMAHPMTDPDDATGGRLVVDCKRRFVCLFWHLWDMADKYLFYWRGVRRRLLSLCGLRLLAKLRRSSRCAI